MTGSSRGVVVAVALVGSSMLHAETITVEHKTFESFEAATRDRFIAVDREPVGVRLARSYLITNEMGVTGKCFDRFGQDGFARIGFEIPIPNFERGLLLIYNSYTYKDSYPKTITVNGRQRPYVHDEARMLTGRWARHDIGAKELKTGANEVIIGGAGGLHVDTFSRAGKSARSFDGGKTFKPDALGPDGAWSGEYIVRLRVYGHPPAGEVTSPVIDPAVHPSDPKIRPKVTVKKVTLRANQTTPEGTQVGYCVRSGTTPSVKGRTWTNWQPLETGGSVSLPGHRYVQWRATLKTDSSSRTPVVRGVRLELEADVDRPDCTGIRVDTYDNPSIIRSSYPFTWESDTPRIRHLREKYKLLDAIGKEPDEVIRQILLRKWVSHQWKNGWKDGKYEYVPPWDALELLELASQDLSLGMCTHYSCTYVQAAAAVGHNARSVIIDHHCVAEVWSNHLGKWLIQDTGPGPGPEGHPVSFAYQADGKWLNALEMHHAHRDKRPVTAVPHKDLKEPWTLDDKWMHLFVRFGIPLRNNHLSQPAPAEIEHGREQYRWDGYLWWTDSVDDPTYPEYRLLSNRVGDFYWTLNRVAADLQQRDADTLTVHLDTQTPNLSRYEAAFDGRGQDWRPVESGFQWPLHEGVNRLRVRPVNAFGVLGCETTIGITQGTSDRGK